MSEPNFQGGRVPCPSCRRKGVGFADHPHAFGYKDYTRARCRYCGKIFRIKDRSDQQSQNPQQQAQGGQIDARDGHPERRQAEADRRQD